MSDVRGYINTFLPGAPSEAVQRAGMTGEVYVENRTGKIAEKFLRSIRRGTMVELWELFILAPNSRRSDVRRRVLADRTDTVFAKGGTIRETSTGKSAKRASTRMSMHAYEQLAYSGRARKRDAEGRPQVWPRSGPMYEGMKAIYLSRRNTNDNQRMTAIKKEYGKSPSRVWLRQQFGGTL